MYLLYSVIIDSLKMLSGWCTKSESLQRTIVDPTHNLKKPVVKSYSNDYEKAINEICSSSAHQMEVPLYESDRDEVMNTFELFSYSCPIRDSFVILGSDYGLEDLVITMKRLDVKLARRRVHAAEGIEMLAWVIAE